MKCAVLCASIMLSVILGVNVAFAASEGSLSNEYLFTAYSKPKQASAFISLEETNRGVSDRWAYVSSSENTDVVLEESYLHWEGVGAEDSSFLIMEICVDNKEGLVQNISYIPSE